MTAKRVPARSEVAIDDTWDLSKLFSADADWEAAFAEWSAMIPGYAKFRGTLGQGASQLAEALRFDTAVDRLGDRLGTFAFLRHTEDVANAAYQGLKARYLGVAAQAAEAASFIRPELLALPDETLKAYLAAPELADYRIALQRVIRFKPHTLTAAEERLLALQTETSQTPRQVFDQLTDADFKFGTITLPGGDSLELSHSSFILCLEHPDRNVRRTAFHQYYTEFADHANSLAATLAGSVKQDVYQSRVRNFATCRAAALFPDQVPEAVYDNLVATVRAHLPAVHRYYDLRRRLMKLDDIRMYDIYVPILADLNRSTPWNDAADMVVESLRPLGADYCSTLAAGLKGRWCDRYENKGKHSGAFSSGCYDSDPHILMNYQADVLDHVFTLAHEAGHSMHTHLSKAQPYHYSNYAIFVAEVASTFNEQLLSDHLMARAANDRERAYYVNREIDDLRKTIVRQTMFAEFEQVIHTLAETNEPLTLDRFKSEYRTLLDAYFGPGFAIDAELELECLRIPHFYRAFYVYKYATGLSAAIALARRVSQGGAAERDAYLNFLRGGCSKDPLDLLRDAGVDMTSPEPVAAAMKRFADLTDELDRLLG